MSDLFEDIEPRVPGWLIDEGCPEPKDGEGLRSYAARIGLSYTWLTEGLTPRTAEVVQMRLAGVLYERYYG